MHISLRLVLALLALARGVPLDPFDRALKHDEKEKDVEHVRLKSLIRGRKPNLQKLTVKSFLGEHEYPTKKHHAALNLWEASRAVLRDHHDTQARETLALHFGAMSTHSDESVPVRHPRLAPAQLQLVNRTAHEIAHGRGGDKKMHAIRKNVVRRAARARRIRCIS